MSSETQWWIAIVPLGIGLLSAGQTIQSKQGVDFFAALTTGWGSAYWISRGLVPVAAYVTWYFSEAAQVHSLPAAALCGLGSEAFLRAKLYVGQTHREDGKPEDVFIGLFNLIEWYQAYFLKRSGISLANRRLKFMSKLASSNPDFPSFSRHVRESAVSLNEDEKLEVRGKAKDLLSEFQKELTITALEDTSRLHQQYILELGFALLKSVGKRGLTTLTSG